MEMKVELLKHANGNKILIPMKLLIFPSDKFLIQLTVFSSLNSNTFVISYYSMNRGEIFVYNKENFIKYRHAPPVTQVDPPRRQT